LGARFVQTLESPELKMLIFPGLESPGKRLCPGKPWKSPGILTEWSWKFYFLVQVSLTREEIHCNTLCAIQLLDRNTFILLLNILWPLLYLHRIAAISFSASCSVSWTVLENEFFESCLENPGISLQVLGRPGKQCFNVCMNPVEVCV